MTTRRTRRTGGGTAAQAAAPKATKRKRAGFPDRCTVNADGSVTLPLRDPIKLLPSDPGVSQLVVRGPVRLRMLIASEEGTSDTEISAILMAGLCGQEFHVIKELTLDDWNDLQTIGAHFLTRAPTRATGK